MVHGDKTPIDLYGGTNLSSESIDQYLDTLEDAPRGEGLRAKDWFVLVLMGVLIPFILLLWGWY